MKKFSKQFATNLLNSFNLKNLPYHLIAILLTYIIVTSGFDWLYYISTQNPTLQSVLWPAVVIGSLGTLILIVSLLFISFVTGNAKLWNTTKALIQAALLALIISSFYKALTGRSHPGELGLDNSTIFQFGWWRGGVFWGWPSGHTTTAFALGTTAYFLYPKSKFKYLATLYAFYIGIGISVNIHWFSDFIAGAIFGTIIGKTVGKCYSQNNLK
ncbi:MAG: phosphatase PAP2 family protein [Patescibacteria group bacterium]